MREDETDIATRIAIAIPSTTDRIPRYGRRHRVLSLTTTTTAVPIVTFHLVSPLPVALQALLAPILRIPVILIPNHRQIWAVPSTETTGGMTRHPRLHRSNGSERAAPPPGVIISVIPISLRAVLRSSQVMSLTVGLP